MVYDVAIVGGGPSGLAAALTLGRARRRVLLFDSGPPRNAPARAIQNFVTRDGVPPLRFREIAREQLSPYKSVEVQERRVEAIAGRIGAFELGTTGGSIRARRVLLCTGMVDEMLPIDGFAQLWGSAIFQCPHCHGWEAQGRRWGYLVRPEHAASFLHFAVQLRAWTSSVTVFTDGAFEVPQPASFVLERAGIAVETSEITRLEAGGNHLCAIDLVNGSRTPCDVLFSHPPQRQSSLVLALGPALDEHGFVRIDPNDGETSLPGIYAAGDLTTQMQGAVLAAAAGVRVAAMITAELTVDLASAGAL